MISDVLTDFNLYVDGRGHAGLVEEINPPKIVAKMLEHEAASMASAIDIPTGRVEKMEMDFTLAGVNKDTLTLWGFVTLSHVKTRISGALRSYDGTTKALSMFTRGLIKELDFGTFKPGDKMPLKAALTLDYYRLEIDGQRLIEIDAINNTNIINDTDQLAEVRQAIGV